MSGDGLLQPRVVSAAVFGGTNVLLRVVRAAVPLQAHLWPLQLCCAALEAPQYVHVER